MSFTLYSYWRSSCSWRVRLALGYKQLDADIVPIHLVKDGGEQFSEAYERRNPMHQLPTLVLEDGRSITQSIAIIEFLEDHHPSPSLLPSDVFKRAQMREVVEIINSGIQPLQNLSLLLKMEELQPGSKGAWGKQVIEKGLQSVERIASKTTGGFLIGENFSIADCCLVPQLYNARRFHCDLNSLPTLLEIEKRCEALPFFAAAHPDNQVDAQ